ncbi:hypothetical protein BD410DRAFT_782049 [Rickenella mellea]|uniref:BTB domain-containing protein n=1 Tax=Rickenella mellea TaxID=50990 RepID=A0A4Y7QLG3_9AGAM|nr:hypothetical protein BD410DRAFT_782049 [Rickenella mellea]
MSGPAVPSSALPVPSTGDELYHSDFCSSTADFVVSSSDGVRFKCHRVFLQEASPVFRSMLSLPQPHSSTSAPSDDSAKPPSIDLPEDGKTVETLLRLIYPMSHPHIDSMSTLSTTLFAAEKYDMAGVISALRLHLRDEQFLQSNPVHVYALACRFGFAQEAKTASRASLTHDIYDPKHLAVFTTIGTKSTDIVALYTLRHRRIEDTLRFLDGERFEGNAADFTCVACDKKLNDITWPLLKTSILKEMHKRPLGDTIFGSEFLKSSAIHSFINSKCEECQERVIYEKGKTLAMISEFLKALPDAVEIENTPKSSASSADFVTNIA